MKIDTVNTKIEVSKQEKGFVTDNEKIIQLLTAIVELLDVPKA